jgi:hypothetical protein
MFTCKLHNYYIFTYHFLKRPIPPNFQNSGCQAVNDEFRYHLIPVFLNDLNGRSSEINGEWFKTHNNIVKMPCISRLTFTDKPILSRLVEATQLLHKVIVVNYVCSSLQYVGVTVT